MTLKSLFRRLKSPPPQPLVISYTPGKVGGTATVRAMREAGLECHQIHMLRKDALIQRTQDAFAKGHLPLPHISMAMALRHRIVTGKGDIRFITGIRDPLEQSLSAFFENLHHRTDGLSKDSPPEQLFAQWIKGARMVWAMGWLDFEMKDQLGVDLLAQPFDRIQRVGTFANPKMLVLRVDCPNHIKEQAMSRFVGRPIRLGRANVGSQKPYSRAYDAVKNIASAPDSVIEAIYDTAYVRHFWTEAEIDQMRAKWRAKPLTEL